MSETCVCQICQKTKSPNDGQIAEVIRPSLLDCIKKHHSEWDGTGFVCFDDIGDCRKEYVKEVLQDEIGELSTLDNEVVESLRQHEIISENISRQFDRKLTFGERLSDRIAEFGGSWRFLITFFSILFVWIAVNGIILVTHAYDPYPFILLNLILSCLAAVQAPVIMMSQNRQAVKDRMDAQHDYEINMKAELEILALHTKLDHLKEQQWVTLIELQERQLAILTKLAVKIGCE